MDLTVRHDLPDRHVPALVDAYRDTWFGQDRSRRQVERMLAGTDAMVALLDADAAEDGSERLVAFGHALTDDAFVAYLRDIVVVESARDRGVGRRLVAELLAHPDLADVEQCSVVCPSRLSGFYADCGFDVRADATVLVRPNS